MFSKQTESTDTRNCTAQGYINEVASLAKTAGTPISNISLCDVAT